VVQQVNPGPNATTNAAANPPTNAVANATGNVANNAANVAGAQQNASANASQNAGAQPPPVQANRAESSQHCRIRDEVEIARRANYEATMGSLIASMPTILYRQRNSCRCMTRSFYDVPNTTKIMVLQMTSTSSQRPMPCQLVRERSTTSQRSRDVSRQSDTPKTSS
jgi:hypothetical protein